MPTTASIARDGVMCGPNSIQLLLRANGMGLSQQEVDALIPTNPQGMSLAEVRDACARHGLPVEVRACSPDELAYRLRSPAIAYTRTRFESAGSGHFVLLLKIDDRFVDFVDATSTAHERWTRSDFDSFYLGYVIVPAGMSSDRMSVGLIGSAGLWLVGGGVSFAVIRHRTRRRASRGVTGTEHESTAASVEQRNRSCAVQKSCAEAASLFISAVTLLLLGAFPASAHGEQAATTTSPAIADAWRSPTNDGLNCLYVEVRSRGFRGSYADFRREPAVINSADKAQDLASLAALANRLGCRLTPTRLSSAELSTLSPPVLVHLEPRGLGSGGFYIYAGGDEKVAALFDGATMRAAEIDRDRFQQMWSGFALTDTSRPDMQVMMTRGLAAASLMFIVFSIHSMWTRSHAVSSSAQEQL